MSKILLPQAVNSIQSQKFGRRIYHIQQGDQSFWLKLQLKHSNQAYQNSFLHELEIYQQLNRVERADQSFLCNFTILDPYSKFNLEEEVLDQYLWVENVAALFAQNPNQLDLSSVYAKLINSLHVLEYLHHLGYVHGDLKKEHFRMKTEQLFLIDFEQAFYRNLSILQNNQIEKPSTNTATPRYMAPELFHAGEKTFQTDIYALGIIWLEWLTQQRLIANSYHDWAILHCQQLEVVLPKQFKALEAILKLMLMKKVEQRYVNIYQIKQQLSQIV